MPKTLKPTLRERNRYLAFEVVSDGVLDRKAVVDSVWGSLLRLYGEVGASGTSLWVMDWDADRKRGVLKVNHLSVDLVRQSAVLVEVIGGKKAAIRFLKVSGTLRGARESL